MKKEHKLCVTFNYTVNALRACDVRREIPMHVVQLEFKFKVLMLRKNYIEYWLAQEFNKQKLVQFTYSNWVWVYLDRFSKSPMQIRKHFETKKIEY